MVDREGVLVVDREGVSSDACCMNVYLSLETMATDRQPTTKGVTGQRRQLIAAHQGPFEALRDRSVGWGGGRS